MAYIKKSANMLLLGLLLVIALGIAALTIVYQENFLSINTEYQDKVSELNTTFLELAETQEIFNRTRTELELKSLREEDLSTQFTSVQSQNVNLTTERDTLLEDKATLEDELLTSKRDALQKAYQIEELEAEEDRLKDSIRNYLDEIDTQKAEIARLNALGCT